METQKVKKLMLELGETYMQCTYQMTETLFWALFNLLSPLVPDSTTPSTPKKEKQSAKWHYRV